MNAPLLETRDVDKHFGGVAAVDAVNFALDEGELRCIIGPNGAGKTTFFKLLTGQYRPDAGQILYRGRDIGGANTSEIARLGIGIKMQVPSVFEELSVEENLWIAARRVRKGETKRELVDSTLEMLHVDALRHEVVARLAHGQRQLVELGTVLAGEPDLILLDEPTAGMTSEEVARAAELILAVNRARTLIVVEHDMSFIKLIASKVTVFHRGTILVEDTMEAILDNSEVRDIYLGRQSCL
ncbi:MAG TPA: ABC transporter ATP-binding protein [Gammaproteobacteria bacterium]|nr:ABC transporter ATP-binding protein [Gammaproteobacteria bacterium]